MPCLGPVVVEASQEVKAATRHQSPAATQLNGSAWCAQGASGYVQRRRTWLTDKAWSQYKYMRLHVSDWTGTLVSGES